jgi:hypothetical protein
MSDIKCVNDVTDSQNYITVIILRISTFVH